MRDFQWDSDLWTVVKNDGRYAGIPCVSREEAEELARQHEGSHIYQLSGRTVTDKLLRDILDKLEQLERRSDKLMTKSEASHKAGDLQKEEKMLRLMDMADAEIEGIRWTLYTLGIHTRYVGNNKYKAD